MTTDRPPAIVAEVSPRGSTGQSPAVGFILGPARSGTTLLYKCLALHPSAAFVTNWRARHPRLGLTSSLTRLARLVPGLERTMWFRSDNAYVYGRPRAWFERAFPAPVEGEPVYRSCGVASPGGPAPRDVDPGVALPAAFRSVRRMGGGRVVLSKRIANNLRIPLLHDVFPAARYLVLTRDGRAVASSLARVDWWEQSFVWWYGSTPAAWAAGGGDPWELCARNWVEEVRAIREGSRTLPPTSVLHLRYEDLIADPIPTLESAAAHLGLPSDRRWSRRLEALSFSDRRDDWRRRLDDEVIARITEIQRDELVAGGYAA